MGGVGLQHRHEEWTCEDDGRRGATWMRLAASDAISGGIATFFADCVMHPVDTVKARLQAQHEAKYAGIVDCFRKIIQREGFGGLYAGLKAVLLGGVPCSMIFFASYQTSRRLAESNWLPNLPGASVDFMSGAIGEVSGLVTYVPSEVIAKRMQISGLGPGRNYQSPFHALRVIFRSEGLRGVYAGLVPTMMRDVPCTALQFMFFEQLKGIYGRGKSQNAPTSGAEFGGIGFVAGGAAAFMTNPFDVVKTRLQTQASGSETLYKGTADCLVRTVREEGFFALWRGASARVTWVAPASAITLAIYEKSASFLNEISSERHMDRSERLDMSASSVVDSRR